jgi:hypothetical protein
MRVEKDAWISPTLALGPLVREPKSKYEHLIARTDLSARTNHHRAPMR